MSSNEDGQTVTFDDVANHGLAGRAGATGMAVVADAAEGEGRRRRPAVAWRVHAYAEAPPHRVARRDHRQPRRLGAMHEPMLPCCSGPGVAALPVEDPTILGLGDLEVKDLERVQPRAGRLDILLFDADSNTRYEVEIQLGPTDQSHIIRTIEYS